MVKRLFGRGRWRLVVLAALLIVVAVFWYEFRMTSRLRFAYRQWRHEKLWRKRSLWLPQYRLARVKEVDGVAATLAG
ncbi:MAG: hypothetical protein LIQ30_12365, partial [Planctomycetes bacterium]|nr:hypothetical protein [Planctomycetota bacterium]